MMRKRRWVGATAGLTANTLLWTLFLLREPVPRASLAAIDAAQRAGHFNLNTSAPHLIARRHVAQGGSHGSDTLAVEAYQWVSLPGVMAGFALHSVAWQLALAPGDTRWWRYTAWPWGTTERRSWALASALYVGTSVWWALSAFVLSGVGGRRIGPHQARRKSEPDNNELQRTRDGNAAASPLNSVFCGPVSVEARRRGRADSEA
jgi:hypothetical protein